MEVHIVEEFPTLYLLQCLNNAPIDRPTPDRAHQHNDLWTDHMLEFIAVLGFGRHQVIAVYL